MNFKLKATLVWFPIPLHSMASPTNGFLDYHGNQSPANENAAIYPSNALRLEDQGVPDFMSPRKKPRKQLVYVIMC